MLWVQELELESGIQQNAVGASFAPYTSFIPAGLCKSSAIFHLPPLAQLRHSLAPQSKVVKAYIAMYQGLIPWALPTPKGDSMAVEKTISPFPLSGLGRHHPNLILTLAHYSAIMP